jgi:hypothetical protein
VEAFNSALNPSSIVNILTLRYDPSINPNLPKKTWQDFESSNEIPNISFIETQIEQEIKEKIVPKIDDDLAKEFEADTLIELKERIKENSIAQEKKRIKDQLQENLMTALIDNNPFDVPEGMIQNKLLYLKDNFTQQLKAQGMSLEMLGMNDDSFNKYIKDKYPLIIFENKKNPDYLISCTVYQNDINKIPSKFVNNQKYIAHEVTPQLELNPNVWYLTPIAKKNVFEANILPFSNNNVSHDKPIYVIQGSLHNTKRNISLLTKILEFKYEYDFKIKVLGRNKLDNSLKKYTDKIIIKNQLNFIDYHKEFNDCYCILPLITKKSHPQYYNKKLKQSLKE